MYDDVYNEYSKEMDIVLKRMLESFKRLSDMIDTAYVRVGYYMAGVLTVDKLVGQRVVVQCRDGRLWTGTFKGVADDFVVLEDAVVQGKKYIVKVPVALIQIRNICHLHPEPKQEDIKPIQSSSNKKSRR